MRKILFIFTLLFSSLLGATTLDKDFMQGLWQAEKIIGNSEDLPTEYKILAQGVFTFKADGNFVFTSDNAEVTNMFTNHFWQWNESARSITVYQVKNKKPRPIMTIGVRTQEKQIYFIILEASLLLQMQKISD